MSLEPRLKEKVAIITGASRGELPSSLLLSGIELPASFALSILTADGHLAFASLSV